MSHIYGHVDDTNTNFDSGQFMRMPTRANLDPKNLEDLEERKKRPSFGVARLNFSSDKKIRQIPFLNEFRIPLRKKVGDKLGEDIGFHIYLTGLDNDKSDADKVKYRGYAADIVLWQNHLDAEALAVKLLGGSKGDKLEDYTWKEIASVISHSEFEKRDELRLVLLQVLKYMQTPSFKILYFDEKGAPLSEEARLDWITQKKVIFKTP